MSAGPHIVRRGLTLVETLVSLALLSAVAVACAGIAELAASRSAEVGARVRWEVAGRAVLGQVAADLRAGDGPVDPEVPKVKTGANRLLIRTRVIDRGHENDLVGRANGQVTYVYLPESGTLVREREGAAPILGQLEGFDASYDPEHTRLTVVLRSTLGPSLHEEFPAR